MIKTKVDYNCQIRVVTAQDEVLEYEHSGSFTLEEAFDSDFGGEDVFIMPEIMREAMYYLNEYENEQAGLQQSKSLDFSITDYKVETFEE